MLAHTASHEGFVAVADICGEADHEMDYGRIHPVSILIRKLPASV